MTVIALNLFSLGRLNEFNGPGVKFWVDGISGVMFLNLLSRSFKYTKTAGPDLLRELVKAGTLNDFTVFGDAPEKFVEYINLNGAYIQNHYPVPDYRKFSLDEIKEISATVVISLPAPAQEELAIKLQEKYKHTLKIYCFGGALHMIHDTNLEAGPFIRKIGLEWLWRLRSDTARRLRRLITSIIALITVIPKIFSYNIQTEIE